MHLTGCGNGNRAQTLAIGALGSPDRPHVFFDRDVRKGRALASALRTLMIYGTGCDITEIARIEHALERFGDHFMQKILSPREREELHGRPAEYLAGRFAAKEAAVKALGTGFRAGIQMAHVEILNNELGAPVLTFLAQALDYAKAHGITRNFLSLSHERRYAVAFVVLETDLTRV